MPIVKEIESVIAQLPTQKAIGLKILLNQFETVRRRNKQLKAYSVAFKAMTDFERSNSNSLWN